MENTINLIWKNAVEIKKTLDAYEQKRVRAAETATKVEGFRLSKELKSEVLSARPGGTKLTPLSQIARYTRTGRLKKHARHPLALLSRLIRYRVTRETGRFNVEVGFVGGKMQSGSWQQLVSLLQAGGSGLASGKLAQEKRKDLLLTGIKLKKRGDPAARFFFLRKSTRLGPESKVPARPEIDPFWNAHQADAQRNIIQNWERKMRGERI